MFIVEPKADKCDDSLTRLPCLKNAQSIDPFVRFILRVIFAIFANDEYSRRKQKNGVPIKLNYTRMAFRMFTFFALYFRIISNVDEKKERKGMVRFLEQ